MATTWNTYLHTVLSALSALSTQHTKHTKNRGVLDALSGKTPREALGGVPCV